MEVPSELRLSMYVSDEPLELVDFRIKPQLFEDAVMIISFVCISERIWMVSSNSEVLTQ